MSKKLTPYNHDEKNNDRMATIPKRRGTATPYGWAAKSYGRILASNEDQDTKKEKLKKKLLNL